METLRKLWNWIARGRGADPATRGAEAVSHFRKCDMTEDTATCGAEGAEAIETAKTGIWGEGVAADFLGDKGLHVVGRRVRIGRDEIDIVATLERRGVEMVVFVEVKTRASDLFGGGRAAMDKRKRHALCRAAAHYLRRLPKAPFRFDLIEVVGHRDSSVPPVIRHYENAFPMELRYLHTGLHRRGG